MPKALVDALGKGIRSTVDHKWLAKCPVHGDKDFAMSVTESDSGRIVIYCHACGANGFDVYRKLSLPLRELFGAAYKPGQRTEKPVVTKLDYFFKAIYEADLERYVVPQEQDIKRYQQVCANIQKLNSGGKTSEPTRSLRNH